MIAASHAPPPSGYRPHADRARRSRASGYSIQGEEAGPTSRVTGRKALSAGVCTTRRRLWTVGKRVTGHRIRSCRQAPHPHPQRFTCRRWLPGGHPKRNDQDGPTRQPVTGSSGNHNQAPLITVSRRARGWIALSLPPVACLVRSRDAYAPASPPGPTAPRRASSAFSGRLERPGAWGGLAKQRQGQAAQPPASRPGYGPMRNWRRSPPAEKPPPHRPDANARCRPYEKRG